MRVIKKNIINFVGILNLDNNLFKLKGEELLLWRYILVWV